MLTVKDFEKLSIRATVAYSICCLENALEFYNLHGEGWNILLANMWRYTELSWQTINYVYPFDTWIDVGYLTPARTCFQSAKSLEEGFAEFQERMWYQSTSKEIYFKLRESYVGTNDVVNVLCQKIYDGGIGQTWEGFRDTAKYLLYEFQIVLSTMYANNIPLPDIEPFKIYPFKSRGYGRDEYGWGRTFDGTQYSKFITHADIDRYVHIKVY